MSKSTDERGRIYLPKAVFEPGRPGDTDASERVDEALYGRDAP